MLLFEYLAATCFFMKENTCECHHEHYLISVYLLNRRGDLHKVACETWPHVSDDTRQHMARMAAAAAWGLGQ